MFPHLCFQMWDPPSLVFSYMALTRHFLRDIHSPRWDCVRTTSESGTPCSLSPCARPFHRRCLETSLHIGALQSKPYRARPHTTFWSWCTHHCWFPSIVVSQRETSGWTTLRRVCLWGWHLPLLTATSIAGALKPLLLSISKCTLRSTRSIEYYVRVPVLWTSIYSQTQSPRWKQPSPCQRNPVGPVTHTAITCRITVCLQSASHFLLTVHLSAHIFSTIRCCLHCKLGNHNQLT